MQPTLVLVQIPVLRAHVHTHTHFSYCVRNEAASLGRLLGFARTPTASLLCVMLPQIVDLMYLEGWLFKAVRGILLSSMQRTLPANMQPHTYVRFEASTPVTEVGPVPCCARGA
jgi:hypothetical protein